MDRRQLFHSSATLLVAGLGVSQSTPAAQDQVFGSSQQQSQQTPAITRLIANYAATATVELIPTNVKKEATRTLLNWVGCAVGGSQQEAPTRAVKALRLLSGPAKANLLGRKERFDILNAALINGISSHVLDYDDTHLKTIIHPAGPVASAIMALAQQQFVSGRDFMNALVIGCEIECRIGNAVYPDHYAKGWHITGTTGMFGAAAAAGRLLGLDETQMTHALGIAASQPVGLKVQFGSDTKSFHPGKAAQNGLLAALLAQQGFTASSVAIEGFDGWGQASSTKQDWNEVTQELGQRYEIGLNTYKPFACGIVAHPAIDAAIQLQRAHRFSPDTIESVTVKVHPLVLNLMGKTQPRTGLEGKFSIYHAIAVALVTARGGNQAFSDAAVLNPTVIAVRQKINVIVDNAIQADQVDMSLTLTSGQQMNQFIEHAVGSQLHPMSDEQLEEKFSDLAEDVLPLAQIKQLMSLCWQVWDLPNPAVIATAAAKRSRS
jgi:2-methylcitrate dehydratase PrpD